MSLLKELNYDKTIAETKDTVGGGFSIRPSGAYLGTVKIAYLEKTTNGALGLNLILDIEGSEYRETLYITGRNGKNFYERDGVKKYLAGFLNADAISLLATGKPLADCTEEKKVVKLWNYEQKKEVPTEVICLTTLHGKKIGLGILVERTFKGVKQPDGSYKDSDETRETNVIDKVFHADSGKTVNEYRAKVDKAEFKETWITKWKDQVKDRTAGKGSSPSSAPKASAGASATATSSLFSD